jgi:hypothetical protein
MDTHTHARAHTHAPQQAIAEFGVISERDVTDLFFADEGTHAHPVHTYTQRGMLTHARTQTHTHAVEEAFEYLVSKLTKNTVDLSEEGDDF